MKNTTRQSNYSHSMPLILLAVFLASCQAFQVALPTTTQRSTSTLPRFYSTTADPPLNEASSPDFAKRMRQIVFKKQKKASLPQGITEIETLEEYKRVVADEADKLTVVRFYAPWCRACRAVAPQYYRLPKQYDNVQFVQVPANQDNARLHQGLGVPSLPYGHIYHPTAGLVEELKMTKKHFKNFDGILQSYVDRECPLGDIDEQTGVFSSPYQRCS